MLRRLQVFLLERRHAGVVRQMEFHVFGHGCAPEESCPKWVALCAMYDDTVDRLRTARA